MTDAYREFLTKKNRRFQGNGFDVPRESLHSILHPHQADGVRWALRKGCAALFWDTGLGKTFAQGEWARNVVEYTGGRVLGLAPLCVAEQTIAECQKIGVDIAPFGSGAPIEIVNYENLHKVDPRDWAGVFLDESSILKSLDGSTRTRLIEMFGRTSYRLACTATPSPNDRAEIGNHAEFLGVMTRAEMLASFFINRGEGNRSWDLKGHAREAFFRWLASWAMFLRKPSDLGYSDAGFILPPLTINGVVIPCDIPPAAGAIKDDGSVTEGNLFADKLKGVGDRARVRKATAPARIQKAAEIVRQSTGQVIVWCGLNDEQDGIAALLGEDCVSVSGSLSATEKHRMLAAFLSGEKRVLVTKCEIAGFGMNFQNARTQVFLGMGDSWEKYYQGIRRSWRYGQDGEVTVLIVLSDLEEEILLNVKRKEREAAEMQADMVGRIAEYEKAEITGRAVVAPYAEEKAEGEGWEWWRGDSIEMLRREEADSVDLSVFSPPFQSLYTYSASDRDLGNCRSLAEFLRHFRYLARELYRVMKPGRIVACHCQQIALQKAKDGEIGMRDFRGALIRVFDRAGFIFHGDVTIDKNPQAQAIRTKSKSLLFVQLRKDSSWMRPAMADYIVLLRKPGDNAVPIHPDCTNEEWIEWAHPNWYGIQESDTLQVAEAREEEDEKHICALQLPTINRCVRLWSNKGETVLDPFGGIASTGYETVKLGRRFKGGELKASYWRTGIKNLKAAERLSEPLPLFAGMGMKDDGEERLSRPFMVPAITGEEPPPGFAIVRTDLLAFDRESHE